MSSTRLHRLADLLEGIAMRDGARVAAALQGLVPDVKVDAGARSPPAARLDVSEEARVAAGHRALLEAYARRVDALIARFRRAEPSARGGGRLPRQLVAVRPEGASWVGTLAVRNPDDTSRRVSFLASSPLRLSPASLVLRPGAASQVAIRADVPEAEVEVLLDGQPRVKARLAVVGAVPTSDPDAPELAVSPAEDALDALLVEAQLAVLAHPLAAQSLFRAFVAEGRAYARTPEGARWRERLVPSELVRRGRTVWEVLTHKVLEEEADSVLPTQLLEAFVRATRSEALEPSLLRTMEAVFGDEYPTSEG